jgi:hypothetical protein
VHVGDLTHAFPNGSFEQGPAELESLEIALESEVFSSFKEPIRVSGNIAANCAGALQLIGEAGKEGLHGLKPSGEEPMSMMALWYPAPLVWRIDQRIALDKDHLAKVIR